MCMDRCITCECIVNTDEQPEVYRKEKNDACICNQCYKEKETLIVKCPNCGSDNDLGEGALKAYNSSMAFMLNRKCVQCGHFFDETDTHEADYRVDFALVVIAKMN